jgi:hypothetical protein
MCQAFDVMDEPKIFELNEAKIHFSVDIKMIGLEAAASVSPKLKGQKTRQVHGPHDTTA